MPDEQFPHDAGYKSIFSDPELVKSLLKDFVTEAFIDELDFSTLERCSGDYVSGDLRERCNDMLWRVRWRDTFCYIYLMVEFQSTQQRWMGLRVLTYTALLWEDLIRTGQIGPEDRLPPVFPIVLYNGDLPWRSPLELGELVQHIHPDLDTYQPCHKYWVLDEKRISPDVLMRARGDAAYVFKVEQAEDNRRILELALELRERLKSRLSDTTWQAMAEWMWRRMRRNAPESEAVEERMLAELIEKHVQPLLEKGREEGRVMGRQEGRAEGEAIGRAEGMRELLKLMLTERFGQIPDNWETALANITEAGVLAKLSSAVYRVQSRQEFELLLMGSV